MKFAIILDGRVSNVILAESAQWVAENEPNAILIDGLEPQPGPGWLYDGATFTTPPEPVVKVIRWTDADLPPSYHWIDVGPFFDRFGTKAISITGSTDPQVQGLVTLLLPRKYVDLKRADLPAMLDLLVSKGLITAGEKAVVLNPQTVDYERHIKGLEQPQ